METIVEGGKQVPDAEVSLSQMSELVSDDVLEKSGAPKAAEKLRAWVFQENSGHRRGKTIPPCA
jgi:hypothetical protein